MAVREPHKPQERNHIATDLAELTTEQRNAFTHDIDGLSTMECLKLINEEDKKVAVAVERELPEIAKAVDLVVDTMKKGGRLIYVGAGTSGRLGVLDAAECPPTFGTPPEKVQGIIAGGREAMFRAQEGAEDDEEQARREVDNLGVGDHDCVCGLAASRRTPYVVAAISRARELKAKTIYVTTNPRAHFNIAVDVAICPDVGPEVIMGSTRMKSGTAQKLVLNMLTTAAMIRLGKVYENMMVDLQITNQKLLERARRIITMACGCDYQTAASRLELAGGHVKTAIVMISSGISATEAREKLALADGFIRNALPSSPPAPSKP